MTRACPPFLPIHIHDTEHAGTRHASILSSAAADPTSSSSLGKALASEAGGSGEAVGIKGQDAEEAARCVRARLFCMRVWCGLVFVGEDGICRCRRLTRATHVSVYLTQTQIHRVFSRVLTKAHLARMVVLGQVGRVYATVLCL